MTRRAPGRPTKNHAVPPGKHCRALVLVDGTAIRKKIKKDYDKAARDLANSRRQLDEFHQTDLPEFTRWLNTHFGAMLTEIRELSHKLAADEELIYQVQNEAVFGGGSYAQAYKRVIDFRENPPPPPPPPPTDEDGAGRERKPPGGGAESGDFDDEVDPLEAFFNEMFGFDPEDDGSWEGNHSRGESRARPTTPANASARLKDLYRTLVRRLHPDIQREMTPQKTEWWHQAQAAYQAGDADQLEVILSLCEIGDSGTTTHTSASLLQRITAQLKSSLREIKRQISGHRRDPAWGFSRRADHEGMVHETRRTLTGELEGIRDRWRQTQNLIAGWKAAAERRQKPRRRTPRADSPSMEFPF